MLLLLTTLAHAVPCGATAADGRVTPVTPISFVTGKAELTEDGVRAAQQVACVLSENPTMTLRVEVHSDSQGSGAFNQKLTDARAKAFREALIGKGVAAKRITATGYGETRPIAPNTTAEGRAQNRRVELHTTPAPAVP